MTVEKDTYQQLFARLTRNLDIFIEEVHNKKADLMATDKWTVKDVLCHIVFWHENYAANYQALSRKQPPPLLNGPGYKLNLDGVKSLRIYPINELINRLLKANDILFTCIVEMKVPRMTYKKDGHVYKTAEFLDLIARHIKTHTKQIKRAK